MNSVLDSALESLRERSGADAALMWISHGNAEGRVIASTVPGIAPDTPFDFNGSRTGLLFGEDLATLPTALRLELPAEARAGFIAEVTPDPVVRLLVVCCQQDQLSHCSDEVTGALEQGLMALGQICARLRSADAERVRLEAMSTALTQAVITTDDEAAVAYLNPAAARLLDLPQGTQPIASVAAALSALQARAVNEQEIDRLVATLHHDPRSAVTRSIWEFHEPPTHLSVSSSPIDTRAGVGRVWVFDDVSDHYALIREAQQAREAQASADERFRMAMENAGVGMCVVDPEGVYLEVNAAMCDLLGRSPADLVGHTWREFTHPDDVPPGIQLVRQTLAREQESFKHRKRYVRPSGEIVWADLSVAPVRDRNGTVKYFVNHVHDVSEQVAREDVAQRERSLLRNVADGLLEPLVLLEPVRDQFGEIVDLRYVEVNQATLDYLSLPREALLGQSLLAGNPNVKTSGLFAQYVEVIQANGSRVWTDYVFDNEVLEASRRYDISAVGIDGMLGLTWSDVTDRYEAIRRIAESEQRFRLLAEHASDVVLRMSLEGLIEWASPSVANVLGWNPEELIGTRNIDLVHPDQRSAFLEQVHQAAATGEPLNVTVQTRCSDGTYRWVESAGSTVPGGHDQPSFRIVRLRDVEEQVKAFQELALSEERFRAAMASAPTGMAIVGEGRQFAQVNPALCRLLRRSEQWLLEHGLGDVIHPDDDASDLALRTEMRRRGLPSATHQMRLLTPDGQVLWVEHAIGAIRDASGTAVSSVSQFVDITAAREARQVLQFLADHDSLTDLKNRRGIVSTIAAVLSHPPRTGTLLGVLFCDVDGLKPVNDTHGHAAGDAVLVEVARRLRRCVRSGDSVGRLGGDEFVVLLTSVRSADDARAVAEKLRETVSQPITIDEGEVQVTMSVGVRVAEAGDDPDEVLRQADVAVYQAKAAGRNTVIVYDPATGL